ncbi:CBS domain-containing protein [Streptomyces sp. NPDC002838]|uniref:CBS domain-containing protein n=1 Tax=Streptomyces sp. NPDC002838 TaxID=3154436 RepID=UPI00332E9BAC
MRARDLAQSYVTVSQDTSAVEALRALVEHGLPGLLVVDSGGQPYAALPACEVGRALLPVQEDPLLAEVIDEPHAIQLCRALQGRKLVDCLPAGRPLLPTATPDCTALKIAEVMGRTRSPLIAVVDQGQGGQSRLLGVITAARLVDQLLKA